MNKPTELLQGLFRPLDGYNKDMPGYEHRKGYNDALRDAMDVLRANGFTAALAVEAGTEPRAWFVKDYADGWIYFDNEADALREVEAMGPGTMMMVGFPPYALTTSPASSGAGPLFVDEPVQDCSHVEEDGLWQALANGTATAEDQRYAAGWLAKLTAPASSAVEGEAVAKPETWQRYVKDFGWQHCEESDLDHYRSKGTPVRPLYAHPAPTPAGEWRTMDSAPKDGTWFIALQDGETFPCEWRSEDPDEGSAREGWWDHFNLSFEAPTMWAPASPAPQTEDK